MVVVVAHLLAGETTPSVHLLALNSHLWLHVAGLRSAATLRATGGLNQYCGLRWPDGSSRRLRRDEALPGPSPEAVSLFFFSSSSYLSLPQSPDWRSETAHSGSLECSFTFINPRSNRPERRTTLVARELARYKVDIAALRETRFSDKGQMEEVGAGYTFLWSGRPRAERRDAGVAFAIWNDIVGRLPCLPQGIDNRLISFRLPLRRGGKFTTIINAYAPPMSSVTPLQETNSTRTCTHSWRLCRRRTS
nr:unnamed protein product [Spirometra erinaceieuropaei]